MLSGFLYGIAAAFFWSLTNIVDKHLTSRHASDGNVGAILILSCFFPAILLPISFSLSSVSILALPIVEIVLLMSSGVLMAAWIYFYLKALTEEDTSVVMTLLVLAPFFSLVCSALILGEHLSTVEIIAGALLTLGALVVAYDPKEAGFNTTLLFYAVAACTVMGLMHTLFKFSTLEGDFWQSMFWRSLGMVMVGFMLCFCFRSIRDRFYQFMRTYVKHGLTLNSVNESLTLLGDMLFASAILLAPIALIQTTEAYQPIFIILLSACFSWIGIDSVREDNSLQSLIQKGIGIILVLIGTLFLVFNNL